MAVRKTALKAKKTVSKVAKAAAAAVAPVGGDDVARKIWLAGVGAYGQLFTEAQGGLGKLSDKAQAAFDDLVARGAIMEDMVKSKIATSEPAHTLLDMADKVQKTSAERRAQLAARVEAVSKAMSEKLAPYAAYMPGAANTKVEELAKQVASLTAEVKALKTVKTEGTKAVARRAPATKPASRRKAG
ncbi:MAG: phasin family protein [Caulobacterales bacterium]|jgi:hypothetical protein